MLKGGGICSQINFYAVGAYLMAKNYHVKFALSWFLQHGMDMDGVFVRHFDLLKAFPNLPFEKASTIVRKGSLGTYGRILSLSEGYFIGPQNVLFLAPYFDKCIFISQDKEKLVPDVEKSHKKNIFTLLLKFLNSFAPFDKQKKN